MSISILWSPGLRKAAGFRGDGFDKSQGITASGVQFLGGGV